MTETITVALNGNKYFGWTSAEVTASMSQAARSFSVTMAEVNLGALGDSFWAAPGDAIEVFIGDTSVLDGFINEYKPSFTATSHTVTITGRGKSQDSVDCAAAAHATGRFENMTVQGIANELAGIVSNEVTADETTPTVSKFQVNQGETIVGAIRRLCHAHGYSVMGLADGSMRLVRGTSSDRYKGVYLREGSWPLLEASATISDAKKFSDYDMKTQLAGAEERFGVNAAAEISKVKDATVTRYRPHVGLMSVSGDSQTAGSAADWQARRIAGKGVHVDVTVQGFFYAGALWEPNKLIYLNSKSLKCDHELLIDSVTWSVDDSGSKTRMKLVPPKTAKSDAGAKSATAKSGDDSGEPVFGGSDPQRLSSPKIADPGVFFSWEASSGVR